MSTGIQPILFVEDDDEVRFATTQALEIAGLSVRAFARAEDALNSITGAFDGAIVSDIRMPGMDGLQLLAAVQSIDRDIPFVLVTGHADVPMAVGALKNGAFDFLGKPFSTDHLVAVVRRALEHRALQIDNRRLRAAADASDSDSPLIGASLAMARLRAAIRQLAAADLDVLVEGETGVGKEVVAALLHRHGPRAGRPLIAVNCAAWQDSNFELALFGHAAETVAHTRMARRGQIAASSGGTLLLDEVDSMPLPLQARLLRVLEEREVQPLGAERPEPINLHVLATSKVDLEHAAREGSFRSDLFHRLATTRLRVPPLRERDDDAVLLFDIFVEEAKQQLGKPDFNPDRSATGWVKMHDWPGNVRELRNFAFSTVVRQAAAVETEKCGEGTMKERVAAFEAELIRQALHQSRGNVGQAISRLGLPRKTFYDKVSRLSIPISELRKAEKPLVKASSNGGRPTQGKGQLPPDDAD
jgi:two-component system C4-dicarboxylate transport response regulator DctD